MAKVGTLKGKKKSEPVFDIKASKAFKEFEKELKAIEKTKIAFREKSFKGKGLMSIGAVSKFLGGVKKKFKVREYGEVREYKRRTIEAYQRRIKRLKAKFKGGATIGMLLKGMDRKVSKTKDKDSDLYGTSRKSRISTIGSPKLYKMDNDLAIFRTPSSGDTKGAPGHYQIKVRFTGWIDGMDDNTNPKSYVRGFQYAMKEPVKVHCTCKDFQFTYGFVASRGNYIEQSGQVEQSYPKIKNPKLENTMCKHLGRVLQSISKGEGGIKMELANLMKKQAGKQYAKPLWVQPEDEQAKKKSEAIKKAQKIAAAAKAKKKAEKGKEYKIFTQKEKDKLFKKLPAFIKKSATTTATTKKLVKDYSKKQKLDPKKTVPYANKMISAAVKAVSKGLKMPSKKAIQEKAFKKAAKSVDKIAEKSKQIRSDLFGIRSTRSDPELYELNLKHLSKKHGKSVAELKKMSGD